MTMEAPKRVGRRSKGDRKLIGFRLAKDRAGIVSELTKAEGFEHVSDWVASVVNERIDNTDLSAIGHQEKLPINRMAS